jgi:hypothetical protein
MNCTASSTARPNHLALPDAIMVFESFRFRS